MSLSESVDISAAAMRQAGRATSYAAWIIGREAEKLVAATPRGQQVDVMAEFAAALSERCPWWGVVGTAAITNYRLICRSYPDTSKLPYGIQQAIRLATRPELRDSIPLDATAAEVARIIADNPPVFRQCGYVIAQGKNKGRQCTLTEGHKNQHTASVPRARYSNPVDARVSPGEAPRTDQTEVCGWNYGPGCCGLPKGHEGIHGAEVRAEVAIPDPDSEVIDAHIVRDVYELEVGPLIADLLNALESNPRDIAASSLLMKGLRDIRSLVDELEEM